MKRKISCVWEYFTEEEGTALAKCTVCSTKIRRGKDGARSSWSATPLWNHLARFHPTESGTANAKRITDEELQKKRKLDQEARQAIYTSGNTPRIDTFLDRKKKWQAGSKEQTELEYVRCLVLLLCDI